MEYIYYTKLDNPVGTVFVYSDLSFILLGEIIERITKQTLQSYINITHYSMLSMKNTQFLPNETMKPFIVPT